MEKELLIIDKVTDLFLENFEGIHTVTYNEENNTVEVSCDLSKLENPVERITINDEEIDLEYIQGPRIIEHLGDLKKAPPLDFDISQGIKGGMACGIVGSNYYGTVTTTVGTFEYEAGNLKCRERPTLVSNNHVLVKPTGTRIWAGNTNNKIATRTCYLPFSRRDINVDVALGKLDSMSYNTAGQIVQIGEWQNIVKVRVGGSIKKYGARTGYRTGKTLKVTNIRVGNRWFRHVYETSRDFGCSGDSGSAVLDNSNNWIGVYSWGEDLGENTCSKHPKGYFWAVDARSQLLENSLNILEIIKTMPSYNG